MLPVLRAVAGPLFNFTSEQMCGNAGLFNVLSCGITSLFVDFSHIITDIRLHSGAHSGSALDLRARDSSSVIRFFTLLLLNGITHGEFYSYTLSHALKNMLCRVCMRKYFDGNILRRFFCTIRSGVSVIHYHSKKTTFVASSFSSLITL